MAVEYSTEVCKALTEKIKALDLHRPIRVGQYDPGDELVYNVTSLTDGKEAKVRLVIERFVGGGFAGQVYQVKVLDIDAEGNRIGGLNVGGIYAMKILIPPSRASALFRNLIYAIGFQGPFQLQVNPAAAKAGALWQKFIRRAAKVRFGTEDAVVDIHVTFVDEQLGSCGELSQWVEGRTWRLEVDENMDTLKRWKKGKSFDADRLGSPEYREKKKFMADFVQLLHDMGAYEFARQYEWTTCKSQPNCLKRNASGQLAAVDFRAGLALLPFLPMSPGDFKLILKGLLRGDLVQFDRGSIAKLQAFIRANGDEFSDMGSMLEDLKQAEDTYRNSVPDITHNFFRLFYSKKLWSTMLSGAIKSWKVRNIVDEKNEKRLRATKILTLIFFAVGLVPFLGRFVRKLWARADWRMHYGKMLTSLDYFKKALKGRITEKTEAWYRHGRVDETEAMKIADSAGRFFCHLPVSILPAGLHRFLMDGNFRKEKLVYVFVRPVRLYFNADMREQWLKDMVAQGQKKHMLSDEDADIILSRVNEPFIQKYLKSLAVHVCTLPVTQVVSVTIAIIYWLTHRVQNPNAWAVGLGIIGFFQVIPISPGSICRGLYVVYLVIRDRDFKNYNIAVFLGFFKYIGYLAFPIQMTYHYPTLSRFMAGHWATEAVHVVPVFGERGALLEHWVYCLFYNWPLTIRRRMQKRAEIRSSMESRYWHIGLYAAITAVLFGVVDWIYFNKLGKLPSLSDIWPVVAILIFSCAAAVTLGARGAALWKRIIAGTVAGVLASLFYTALTGILSCEWGIFDQKTVIISCVWRMFSFAVLGAIGVIITELKLPDPDLK